MTQLEPNTELLRLKAENEKLRLENAGLRKPRRRRRVLEYGLVAAGIAFAIISAVNGVGRHLEAKFKSISEQSGTAR